MSTWNIPAKLPYALFVAGDTRLGEDARPALNRVLEALSKGPPAAVELRAWIAGHGRMGTIEIEALRAQIPVEALADASESAADDRQFAAATNAMIIASGDGAALDARAPWGMLTLAATLASASDGSVYDSGTLRIVPRWILENPLDGLMLGSVRNHVAIVHSTDMAGIQTTTTLGLNKYGLFELKLSGLPTAAGNVGPLLAGLAQAVVDARPPTPGNWDVPMTFEVTRFHVAHAYGTEFNGAGGRVRLTITAIEGDDVYWRVATPDGDFGETSLIVALSALDIDVGNATLKSAVSDQ